MSQKRVFELKKMHSVHESSQFLEYDNHEALLSVEDNSCGLKAFVGIHSTVLGPALGGTRLQSYDSEWEAIEDVLRLSKAMSYKCALANLPYGGGKAVIVIGKGDLRLQLKSYAEAVDELSTVFKTGTDVGISDDDVRYMSGFCSNMLGMTEADRDGMSTSDSAAQGVFYAIRAAVSGLDLESIKNLRVAIKGVGKLGGKLAQLLYEQGAELYVADIDVKQLKKMQSLLPNIKVVPAHDVHRQKVDVYAPCALGNEIDEEVVDQLNCRAIVGGANNQLSSPSVGDKIHQRGVLYVPDYVANAGGLIYVADELESGGFNRSRVIRRIKDIEATAKAIIERSREYNRPTYEIADTIAQERLLANKNHVIKKIS